MPRPDPQSRESQGVPCESFDAAELHKPVINHWRIWLPLGLILTGWVDLAALAGSVEPYYPAPEAAAPAARNGRARSIAALQHPDCDNAE